MSATSSKTNKQTKKKQHILTQHTHTLSRLYYHFLFYLFFFSDQRITQDVNRFCEEVSQALPKLVLQPFLIAYYSYRTFARWVLDCLFVCFVYLFMSCLFCVCSLGWYGVLGIYGFFTLSTAVNKFIMGPIVSYVFIQEQREGDYRWVIACDKHVTSM